MTRNFPFLALATACLSTMGLHDAQAQAVVPGSTYSLRLSAISGSATELPAVVFDGLSESFQRTVTLVDGTQQLVGFSVNEEQSDGADGTTFVRIVVSADADLFPTGGNSVALDLGGRPDNPLDLVAPMKLLSGIVTLMAGATTVQSVELQPSIATLGQDDPWGGYLPAPGYFVNLPGSVGMGVDHIGFTLRLTPAVPEPATWALCLVGLAALGRAVQRRDRA